MINPKTVQRRQLRFDSLGALEVELDRIERAHREGRLRTLGNWSAGTILGHLATWLEYGWKGYPASLNPPWFVRLILRLRRARFLSRPLPAGFRIPGIEGGTLGTETMEFDEGLARFRRALEPLKRGEAPVHASPAFGRVGNAETIQATLRHAELHLGYLSY